MGQLIMSTTKTLKKSKERVKNRAKNTATKESRKQKQKTAELTARYRSFVNNFRGIVFQGDMDFVPLFFHGAVEKITGYKEAAFVSGNPRWDQIIHPDDLPKVCEEAKKIRTIPKYSVEREYRIVRKNGQLRFVHEEIFNMCDNAGKPVLVQGVIYDITDQKKAEEALRKSESFKVSILETIPHAVVGLCERQILTANEGAETVFGWKPDELIGKNTRIFYRSEEEYEEIGRHFYPLLKKQRSHREEFPCRRKDGKDIICKVSASVIGESLEKKKIVVVYEDITESKRAEEKLIRSEERYKQLIRTSVDGIISIDSQMKIILWNQGAERIFGYTKKEMLGQDLMMIVPEGFREAKKRGFLKFKKDGSGPVIGNTLELEGLRKDGTKIPIGLSVSSRKVGQEYVATAIVRDISEQKRAENDIKQKTEDLNLLNTLNNAVNRGKNLQELSQLLFVKTRDIFPSSRGASLLLMSKDKKHLTLQLQMVGVDLTKTVEKVIGMRMPEPRISLQKESPYLKLLQDGKGLLVNDSKTIENFMKNYTENRLLRKFIPKIRKALNIRSLMTCPLCLNDDCLGVLEISSNRAFRESDLKRFEVIAEEVTLMLGRKQVEERLKISLKNTRKALEETVSVLVSTSEKRDAYTAGHQERVAKLASAIAGEMSLSKERIKSIKIASSVHDVGKICIPSEILNKPSKLTEIEMALIKTHSQVGWELLKDISFPWPVAEIVLQHHERMNGSGYPRSLSGKDILLEARIIAVADVVEAMASHRPYRAAHPLDAALDEIYQNGGILYDADVVDACLKLFKEKQFNF